MTTLDEPTEQSPDGRVIHTFDSARATGLLWAINKVLMHPRGFALAWEYPSGATLDQIDAGEVEPIGFSLVGAGTDPWQFTSRLDGAGFDRWEAFLAAHRSAPNPRGAPVEKGDRS